MNYVLNVYEYCFANNFTNVTSFGDPLFECSAAKHTALKWSSEQDSYLKTAI